MQSKQKSTLSVWGTCLKSLSGEKEWCDSRGLWLGENVYKLQLDALTEGTSWKMYGVTKPGKCHWISSNRLTCCPLWNTHPHVFCLLQRNHRSTHLRLLTLALFAFSPSGAFTGIFWWALEEEQWVTAGTEWSDWLGWEVVHKNTRKSGFCGRHVTISIHLWTWNYWLEHLI